MVPLDLHDLAWKDFFVSGIFFVADLLITVLAIPIIILIMDNRKWRAARWKVGELSARYLNMLEFHFSVLRKDLSGYQDVFPEAFAGNNEAYTEEGLQKQRQMLFLHLAEQLPGLKTSIEEVTDSYVQEMQLLSPAFSSEVMIQQIRFYQASVRPQGLAQATMNYWLLVGRDDPEQIGVNKENENLHIAAEQALKTLCKLSKLTLEESGDRLSIPKYAASKEFDSTDGVLYPEHDPIYVSLQQISTILNSGPRPRLPVTGPLEEVGGER